MWPFAWKRICAGLLLFVYICIAVGDPFIKRGGVTDLTPPNVCACPKPGPVNVLLILVTLITFLLSHKLLIIKLNYN